MSANVVRIDEWRDKHQERRYTDEELAGASIVLREWAAELDRLHEDFDRRHRIGVHAQHDERQMRLSL